MTDTQRPLAVVTGASSGIGAAIARELAASGATVVVADLDAGHARAVAEEIGGTAFAQACDVTDPAAVERMVAVAVERSGGLDILVNNAGISSGGLIGEIPIETWHKTIDIDLWGVIYGCHVFVPLLRKQGHGAILNVASAAGLLAAPRMAAYNVAKAGVVSLSETLAAELRGTEVSVTVLCPTFFRTNIAADGMFSDPRVKRMAEKLVERGRPVEEVVQKALADVESRALYCVPMADGRWLWRLKRVLPGAFRALIEAHDRYLTKKR